MRLAHDVTISRDEWGVPHIHGRSDASVAFGVAYAMAEDNYWQIEEDFLEDLGRSAQWYGESRLAADLVRAAFRVESLAREEYAREPPERRRVWDAFALGLNHYLAAHPGTLRRIIGRYEPWMVFARYRDAHAEDVIDGLRLGTIAPPDGRATPPGPAPVAPDSGSAAWAVAPARTAAGRALLIASRTAPFFGRGQLYELHLHSDEGWHVSGVARLGTPVPSAGHNEQLAWTHTRGLTDRADVFRVVFDHPEDSLAYRHGDEWRRAITWIDTLLVNTPAGVQAQEHGFLRTHHGPVITRRGDTAYVAAIAGLEEGGALAQWYALGRATSLDAFRSALAGGAASLGATMYADVAGNIMYVEAAAPGRAEAPSRTRPVSGNDPAFEWQAAAPLDQRPQLLNPASGMIVSTPALRAAGMDATYPDRLAAAVAPAAPGGLAADRITLEAAQRLPFEARVPALEHELAVLIDEWEQVGGSNSRRAAALDDAVERLRSWNGVVTSGSVAATLYFHWQERAAGSPPGSYAAFRALEEAVSELRREWGTDSVAWGEANRLARTHTSGAERFRDEAPSEPLGAAPLAAGATFNAEAARGTGRRRYARSGTAWISLIELGNPPGARAVVPFGQSADPASRHFFDQAARYAGGELREAWFMPDQVRAHATRSYTPGRRADAETVAPAGP